MRLQAGRLKDGKPEVVGGITLRGGRVRFRGFRKAAVFLARLRGGVKVDGRVYTPKDGRGYLRALLRRYRGDYLWVEEVGDGR